MAKDRRSLTDEEAALWQGVARTARPLRRRRTQTVLPEPRPEPAESTPAPASTSPPAARSHHLAEIDRRTTRRIARGVIALEARLDLHGMTQAAAHRRLVAFLQSVWEEGGRTVLVITGKGTYGDGDRGVLRRSLPHWLEAPPLRSIVAGYDTAHRNHGGAGAFYVRLRRNAKG